MDGRLSAGVDRAGWNLFAQHASDVVQTRARIYVRDGYPCRKPLLSVHVLICQRRTIGQRACNLYGTVANGASVPGPDTAKGFARNRKIGTTAFAIGQPDSAGSLVENRSKHGNSIDNGFPPDQSGKKSTSNC